MASNLFISYDLKTPGQSYDRVIAAIKATCPLWAKLQYSYFYVRTDLTAKQVCDAVWKAMDANDSIVVVDASHGQAAWRGSISPEAAKFVQDHWQAKAA